jgi:uncharacterized tellurite resistance protein B-like protein
MKNIDIHISESTHPFEYESTRWGNSIEKESAILPLASNRYQKILSDYETRRKKERILYDAIVEKKIVLVKDYKGHAGLRTLEPINFVDRGDSIWCFEHEDQKNKQFIISRIGDIELLDRRWEYEDKHTKGETDIFRWSGSEKYRVRIDLKEKVRQDLLERFPAAAYLSSSELYPLSDGVWRLDTMVTSLKPVVRFYAGWLSEIDIVDTPALQEAFDDYIFQNSPPVRLRESYTDDQQKAILSLLYDVMMADKEAHPLEKKFLNKYLCKFKMSIFDFEYIEKERSIQIVKNMTEDQKSDIKRLLDAMADSDHILKEEEKKYIVEIITVI